MSAEIPDPIASVIAVLAADAELVAALAGGKVYGGDLPSSVVNAGSPRREVVVSAAGGLGMFGSAGQPYGDTRIDVRCYGPTSHAGYDLWRVVHPTLKAIQRQQVGDCLLHWVKPAGGPLGLTDPDTDWPFTLSSWQVFAAEVAAA